jgi:DNA polymerase III gamma/tau subunit
VTPGAALFAALLAAACGHPEQRVLDQYFNAVNAQDNQTLSSFAAVKFDQKVDRWSIVQVSAESKAPASLPELVKKAKDVEKQIAENKKAASQYFLDNPKVVQIQEAQRKDAKVPANLQAIAAEWEKFNQKDRDLKKALAEAKEAVDKEKRDVQLSVGDLADVETLSGEVTIKTVDLNLTIKGEAKPYVMGLKKYDLQPSGQGGRTISRWIVHRLDPKA